MLQESARLSPDPILIGMVNEYKKRLLAKKENKVWERLFDDQASVPRPLPVISQLPHYNWLFIYALTCDRWLAEDEVIVQQLKSDYCSHQQFSPACATHQLMGYLFMDRFGCRDGRFDKTGIPVLQKEIVLQLTWDIRVVDVYIQRVLMLTVTGAGDQIKPVWISRILEAQAEDGGWDDFDPLFPGGGGSYVGFTNKGIAIGRGNSRLHSTGQAIYLLSLLLK